MKYTWKPTILLALAVLGAQFPATSSRADLIGYWPFEDGAGSDVALDSSGNENHGLVVGDADFVADGRIGGAIDFGDWNNGAYIDLTPAALQEDGAAGFNALVDTQNVTISYWLNRGGEPATDQWTFWFGPGRQLGSHAPWSNGQIYFDVAGCCAGNQRINGSMGGTDTDGEWHHIVYRKDKPDGEDLSQTSVWLDGVKLLESGGFVISDITDISDAAIGSNAGGGSSQNGLMDEFAIWNEALEDDLIIALSQGASVLPTRDLPGDFNLDGVVDVADFAILRDNFGGRFSLEEAADKGDFTGDLRVNLKDFVGFRDVFNAQGQGAVAAAVPEPAGWLLGCWGLLVFTKRRRRER